MKSFHYVLMVIASMIAISCSHESASDYAPNQKSVAYGYVHECVGKAEVTVDAKGRLSVSLDDAFMPNRLAMVELGTEGWSTDNTASYIFHHKEEIFVAKYVEYLDKVYVAVKTGANLSYIEADNAGRPVGDSDLDKSIIHNQETMATYFNAISAGEFKLLRDFHGNATPVTTTKYGGLTKKTSPGYWQTGQTWVGNIRAIEDFVAGNGSRYSLAEMHQNDEDAKGLKFWSVADAVTGATNVGFKDYFGLVQLATGRLKTKLY